MIWSFAVLFWTIALLVIVAMLCTVRRGPRVLGVAFSPDKTHDPEIKRVLRGFVVGLCAVLLVSAAAGFLLFLPQVREYAELCLFALTACFLLLCGAVLQAARKRLLTLRAQSGWQPETSATVSVDLTVSREKQKGACSPLWAWGSLLLSFLPAVLLLIFREWRAVFPLPFAFFGPFCTGSGVVLYYALRSTPVRTKGSDTAAAVAYAQRCVRIQTQSAALFAAGISGFWLLLCASVIFSARAALPAAVALLLVFLACSAVSASVRQERLDRAAFAVRAPEPVGDGVYKWGCYCDPNDPRLFVPKPVASLGWTVNVGRPAGKAILAGLAALLVGLFGLVAFMSLSDFTVTIEKDGTLCCDAPLYDLTVTRGEVASVELLSAPLPAGTRTNGYGGAAKSYGNFRFDGYGNCKLYVYNDVPLYVCLRLAGDNPAYLLVNAETEAQTQALFETLSAWQAGE